jgi:hypothetical protein
MSIGISVLPEDVRGKIVSVVSDRIKELIIEAVDLGKYLGDAEVVYDYYKEVTAKPYNEEDVNNVFLPPSDKSEMEEALKKINRRSPGGKPFSSIENVLLEHGQQTKGVNLVTGKSIKTPSVKKRSLSIKKSKKIHVIKSEYRGVSWDKLGNRWRCRIHVKGKDIEIGSFSDEVQAAKAYDKYKFKVTHGDLSRLNFPGDYQ